jgi:ACS family tartrate transporter-like MFS transporter
MFAAKLGVAFNTARQDYDIVGRYCSHASCQDPDTVARSRNERSGAMNMDERVFAKCAWRLIPLMAVLYVVNFLDRVNVGFAALSMNKDLAFTPSVYGIGAGALFVGFFAFSVPSTVILEKYGVRRWLFGTLTIWGALSASTALVRTPLAFYTLRFLLGIAEAGFIPGMIVYLTYWFPKAYRARFGAGFLTAQPIAFIIGSPLSGVILSMDGVLSLKGWQWLFLLEGLPAVLFAFVVLIALPDTPAQASWLSAQEKQDIAARLSAESRVEHSDLWRALLDPRVIALGMVNFGILFGLYGITLWLPQIVRAMGFSILATSFIVALPFIASVPAMILWGFSSDKRGERIWHVALPLLLAAAGFFLASATSSSNTISLLALSIALVGMYPVLSPIINLPSSFLGGEAGAAGTALSYAIGSLGAFFGPSMIGFIKEFTGGYSPAMVALACALVIAAMIVLFVGRAMTERKVQFT